MIALITPTGGRKAQIHMLSMFMQNQDYNKQVLWVIVDDCTPETTQFIDDKGFKPKWMVIRLYPELHWERGQNTQARNLLAGIAEAEKYDIEKIKFSGFIAQEVEQAAIEVGYDFSGVKIPSHDNELYGLTYSEFVVPLVKATQEQQLIIEEQKQINKEQEDKIKNQEIIIQQQQQQINEILKRLEEIENK
jgi:hypothetical protein